MSAVRTAPPAQDAGIAVALLGTGGVGRAFLRLLSTPAARGLSLVGIANSRQQHIAPRGIDPARALTLLARENAARNDAALLTALRASGAARRILIDASACTKLATRHARWLDAGFDVVSANKHGSGGSLAQWQRLSTAQSGHQRYGDSATVGAGLPVLSSLRRLHGCGDALLHLRGVFSGSLSYLFNRYDGSRPFSAVLDEALAQGLTEPDPRIDLGGMDAARKLMILARSIGIPLTMEDIVVENLVPQALRNLPLARFLEHRHQLDAPFAARRAAAHAQGRSLRHIAQLDANGRARVTLIGVDANDPAAALDATDNLFALTTQRYRARPLLIQGPGAGPEITAQALLGDIVQRPNAWPTVSATQPTPARRMVAA